MFVDMLIFQRRKYFTSVSINRFFNDINHWIFVHPFLEAFDRLSSTKYLFYKNFPKFVGKHLCWNLCFNKLRPWGMQLYQSRDSGTEYFPVNITNTFLQKILKKIAYAFPFELFSTNLLVFWHVSDLAQRKAFSFAQKQPPEVFSKKKRFWKFCDIHRSCNFTKMRLQQRYFSVDIAKFLRAPIFKKICERLLLFLIYCRIITAICFLQYI